VALLAERPLCFVSVGALRHAVLHDPPEGFIRVAHDEKAVTLCSQAD
jgi:hypothetical protein